MRVMLMQSGLPHSFWADATRVATEHLNRVADLRPKSPHELRFGVPSALRLIPFGAGVRYLLDGIPRGKKMSPKTRAGVFIGYGISKSVLVLDLELFATEGVVKVVLTRDYRLVSCGSEENDVSFLPVRGVAQGRRDRSWLGL